MASVARAFVLAAAIGACKERATTGEPLRVAAAADLTLAFAEAGAAFEQRGGPKVDLTFGASGMLAQQLDQGAPFDVFAAANVSFVDDVVKNGACRGDTKAVYALGHIVLWAADERALPNDITELVDPKYKKVAIANPEHAPYGRAARDALEHAGVWSKLNGRIVYGENVQQTLAFAKSGNADVAIVAQSLVANSHYRAIAPALYSPLEQAIVACNGGRSQARTKDARAFVDFIRSEPAREILRRHGFAMPSDASETK